MKIKIRGSLCNICNGVCIKGQLIVDLIFDTAGKRETLTYNSLFRQTVEDIYQSIFSHLQLILGNQLLNRVSDTILLPQLLAHIVYSIQHMQIGFFGVRLCEHCMAMKKILY